MAIVERFKQESMYAMSAKNIGRCGEVAVGRGAAVISRWFKPLRSSFVFIPPCFLFVALK